MGTPSAPAPPAPPELPPPPPNELDPAVKARRERFRIGAAAGGRRSTILTSSLGLPSLTSDAAPTLLTT